MLKDFLLPTKFMKTYEFVMDRYHISVVLILHMVSALFLALIATYILDSVLMVNATI